MKCKTCWHALSDTRWVRHGYLEGAPKSHPRSHPRCTFPSTERIQSVSGQSCIVSRNISGETLKSCSIDFEMRPNIVNRYDEGKLWDLVDDDRRHVISRSSRKGLRLSAVEGVQVATTAWHRQHLHLLAHIQSQGKRKEKPRTARLARNSPDLRRPVPGYQPRHCDGDRSRRPASQAWTRAEES